VAEVRDGEDLLARLSDAHNAGVIDLDHPLVAQTPNGSYTFAVERLEQQETPTGPRTVLRLREVERADTVPVLEA
jgi:hypothetical protein